MDPQTALFNLLKAFSLFDRDEALEMLDSLNDWIKSGGFPPEVFGPDSKGAMRVYNEQLPVTPPLPSDFYKES